MVTDDHSGAFLRLDLQRTLLPVVDAELRRRLHAPPSPPPTGTAADGEIGDLLVGRIATLPDEQLEALRLKVATALLHEVDRLLSEGMILAKNEEMA